MNEEQPRQKRKYTKKSKMLLRSNYDYIDHEYWPKEYAKWQKTRKNLDDKYGVIAEVKEDYKWSKRDKKKLKELGAGKKIIIQDVPSGPLFKLPLSDD